MLRRLPVIWLFIGLLIAGVVAWYVASRPGANDGQQGMMGGPAPVAVLAVRPEPIKITSELPGRVAPLQSADVRARVSGIVIERVFTQGATIAQGDILYRIDPGPFRARLESAEGAQKRAEAVLVQAREQAERIRRLRERKVASAQDMDNAEAGLKQAEADVARTKADTQAARLDLENTEVKAPISGLIGRALVTEGALVGPGDAQPLATINQLDVVYADFTQPAGEMLALRRAVKAGAIKSAGDGASVVTLVMDDGALYPHAGRLLFSEAVVEADTGQVTLRGEFANPDGDLLPGLYVRGIVDEGTQDAIAVPQQAVQRDGAGKPFVYVIEGETANIRPVTLGRADGNRWIVETGLSAGERIVVEGFQKLQPGGPVVAKDWVPQPQASAAAPQQD